MYDDDPADASKRKDEEIVKAAENDDMVKYVSKIHSAESLDNEGLKSIAGRKELIDKLNEKIILPLKNRDSILALGGKMPNGLVLYGPPGCGKTFIGKCLAKELGFNFAYLSPTDIGTGTYGTMQKKIAAIFADARLHGWCMLFFDECEQMFPSRMGYAQNAYVFGEAVCQMLTELNNCSDRKVFVVIATNFISSIDSALLRSGRIGETAFLGLPDLPTREEALKRLIEPYPHEKSIDMEDIARRTDGLIFSDIERIVEDAKRYDGIHGGKDGLKIRKKTLEKYLKENKPSVNAKELEAYNAERDKFEGRTPEVEEKEADLGNEYRDSAPSRSIGFGKTGCECMFS